MKTSSFHPLALAATSVIGVFFYVLGVAHLVDGFSHYVLGWPIRVGWDYEIAAVAALTFMLVRPILPHVMSETQAKAEKEILDQALAINRAAKAPNAPPR
jgi:hypothetical protein